MTDRGRGGPSRSALSRPARLPAAPGVVETIANGFSLILVYPALAAVPFAVDALAWAGLRVSPAALAQASSTTADALKSVGLQEDLLRLVAVFIRSLLSWVERDELFTLGRGVTWTPASSWLVVLLVAVLLLVGSFVHALFRVPLAIVLRKEPIRPVGLIRGTVVAWIRLVGLGALVATAFALLLAPLAVAGGLLAVVGVNAAPLIGTIIGAPLLLGAVYLYFAPAAIAVSQVGPIRACYLSFNVVRRNFWPVVGLIGSMLLISTGLPVLWLSRADHPIGLLIGVFCNALVSTGLVLASMQFYLDRLGRWQRASTTPGQASDPRFAHGASGGR